MSSVVIAVTFDTVGHQQLLEAGGVGRNRLLQVEPYGVFVEVEADGHDATAALATAPRDTPLTGRAVRVLVARHVGYALFAYAALAFRTMLVGLALASADSRSLTRVAPASATWAVQVGLAAALLPGAGVA